MSAPPGNYVVRFRLVDRADVVLPDLKAALLAHPAINAIHQREVDVFNLGTQGMAEYGAVELRALPSFEVAVRIVKEARNSISEPGHPRVLEGDLSATKV